MEKGKDLIKVFAGNEAKALLIKERLEEIGVSSLIKNDSRDAFFGVAPAVVDLYIQSADSSKAAQILKEEGIS